MKDITKNDLEIAEFNSIVYNDWVSNELFRRLKESYKVQELLKRVEIDK